MRAPRRDWAGQRAAVRALVFGGAAPDADDPLFARTDPGEVARTHARVIADLLARKRRGAAPLAEVSARTLAGVDAAAVVRRFCASPWFDAYGEVPDRDDRRCVEDAFYRHLGDEGIGDPDVRRVEMADAVIRALAVQPRPAFRIPEEIARMGEGDGEGFVAIVTIAGRRVAFAAAGGRVLRGPADAVIAALQEGAGTGAGTGSAL